MSRSRESAERRVCDETTHYADNALGQDEGGCKVAGDITVAYVLLLIHTLFLRKGLHINSPEPSLWGNHHNYVCPQSSGIHRH